MLLKTSLLLINKTTYHQVFSLNQYKNIKEGCIPNGVTVEVAYSESYTLNFVSTYRVNKLIPVRFKNISLTQAKELTDSFFMVSIQIGRLIFRVSYLPPNSLIMREMCLKTTETLYPWKSNLPFYKVDTSEEIWNEAVSHGLELHMFHSSMTLVDSLND
ncbi:hypothetical protein [Nostoc sp. WHI]|uniref:hypothetical protein n=1 Tax=Nostoc sp. WHI TaxID=2650611 RepID=UPI0018C81804|nr:hypothetical protein [Nostoc sp. WHI]MBG1269662.1 hypothetical protein [Nostoc sp. WHI]